MATIWKSNSEHGDDENVETDDEEEPAPVAPVRELRARGRASLPRLVPTVVIPRPVGRTRSAQITRVALATPPATPRTPSSRLSKLSILASDEKESPDSSEPTASMDIDVPTPAKPSREAEPQSIYARARALIRAANTSSLSETLTSSTSVIAARTEERTKIQNFILGGDFLSKSPDCDEECPSSLYISGSPGTGKTALVTDILRQLALTSSKGSITPTAVYVNCMGLPDTRSVWTRVWEELVSTLGGSVASKLKSGDAKKHLEDALKRNDGLRCVLVLDELDFISRTPAALSEIYQLAHKYPASLRLIGISNTLTLGSNAGSPDSPTTPSKSSRSSKVSLVGPQISLNFSAYSSPDLLVILKARLSALGPEQDRIINPTALTFLSKKVAASNGDVR
ncbi:AAA ATPase, partial [Tulasnella sp. 418]